MEVKRINAKKVFVNIVSIVAIFLVVLYVSYFCYIVWLQFPVPPALETLQGRMYGNVERETYLLIDDTFILSMQDEEHTIPTSEYVDGILTLKEIVLQEDSTAQDSLEAQLPDEKTYTFIFLQGDRIFFQEKNMYMELIWLSE